MTNSEAIRIINQYDCNFYWTDGEKIPTEDLIEAFELAVKALDATEPRVLTLDELRALYDTVHFVWAEDNGEDDCFDEYAEVNISYKGEVQLYVFGCGVPYEPDNEMYGKTWRCWSSCPTVKQRGATPWNT